MSSLSRVLLSAAAVLSAWSPALYQRTEGQHADLAPPPEALQRGHSNHRLIHNFAHLVHFRSLKELDKLTESIILATNSTCYSLTELQVIISSRWVPALKSLGTHVTIS